MEQADITPQSRRHAVAWLSAGLGAFLAALFGAGLAAQEDPWVWGTAGFVGFVLCTRRSLVL